MYQNVQNVKSPEEGPVQGWNMLWNKSWNWKIKSTQFIGGYFCNIFNHVPTVIGIAAMETFSNQDLFGEQTHFIAHVFQF